MIEFFDGILTIWIIRFQMNKRDVSLLGLRISSYNNKITIGNFRLHTVSAYFNK